MQPKKRNIQKDILFILISSFIVVVAWIAFNLYHIWVTSTMSENIQMQLTPIDPNFDPQTISQLKTRTHVDPLYNHQASTTQPTPTTIPQVTSEPATDSAQLESPSQAVTRQGQ